MTRFKKIVTESEELQFYLFNKFFKLSYIRLEIIRVLKSCLIFEYSINKMTSLILYLMLEFDIAYNFQPNNVDFLRNSLEKKKMGNNKNK